MCDASFFTWNFTTWQHPTALAQRSRRSRDSARRTLLNSNESIALAVHLHLFELFEERLDLILQVCH